MGLTSSVTRSRKACWLAQPPLRCSLTEKTPSQTLLRRLQLACVLTLPVLSLDLVSQPCPYWSPLQMGRSGRGAGCCAGPG